MSPPTKPIGTREAPLQQGHKINGDFASVAAEKIFAMRDGRLCRVFVCIACRDEKTIDKFDASRAERGHELRCKACRSERTSKYRLSNPEVRKVYIDRNRAKRVAGLERKSPVKSIKRDAYHERARVLLRQAVVRGDIVKPASCERCGAAPLKTAHIHGHHHDYSKPLDVAWLCLACHGAAHRLTDADLIRDAEAIRAALVDEAGEESK